jgi:pimeloyl-ACP methyl ester carboxylesterase
MRALTSRTVVSKDGTSIAFDTSGSGPALILVDGALTMNDFASKSELVELLAPQLTVYRYNRRGRGESGDTPPYAVDREIEDIAALIDVAGGTAALYGHSSGASLAMLAAIELGSKVTALAMYEPPYNDDPAAQHAWSAYIADLTGLLAAGRRGDAVARFMALTGAPDDVIAGARHSPMWPALEAVAPTLAYDHTAILGETAAVPVDLAAQVRVPALVMSGSATFPFMIDTAKTLGEAIPQGEFRLLEGQTHEVRATALAPELISFIKLRSGSV